MRMITSVSRRWLCVVICLFLGACSGNASDSSKTSRQEAASDQAKSIEDPSKRYGGRLVLSTVSDPKTFNPVVAKETSTTVFTSLMFEGLTETNGITTEVEPALAESWTISDDGLVWTFQLRPGLKWSDGQPLTAQDVAFTFNDLIYNPDIPTSSRDIFTLDGQAVQVTALDKQTVEFRLPMPFAPFLRSLSQEIMPRHILEGSVEDGTFNSTWGLDTPPQQIVGSGPFLLTDYRPGQSVVMKRNPHYWKTDEAGNALPYLNALEYLIVQNQDVQLLRFQEGSLDVYGLRGSDYGLLKPREAELNFTVYETGPAFSTSFVFFNMNPGINADTGEPFVEPHKRAWFENLEFRRAVAHAIDKQSMINIVMNGLGFPQESAMSPSAGFFHNADVVRYEYDLDRASELLEQAGFVDRNGDGVREDTEGHPLEFSLVTNAGNTERVQIMNIIRKDLEKLGMQVHVSQLEFNNLVNKLNSTFDWEAMLLGLTGGIEPHFGKNVWHSSGQLHMWYPRQTEPATDWEAEIDRIFVQGLQELDPDKRKQLYDRWQRIVSEQLPLIYTVLPANITAVKNRFGNLKPAAYGGVLHNIEELYVVQPRN